MAAVKKRKNLKTASIYRVSPLKPGLRGARNWASAQMRAAGHTRKAMLRFIGSIFLVLSALLFLALWLGGFMPQVRQGLHDFKVGRLMSMGFVVKQIDVMGEGRLHEADVRAAVGIYPGEYFFGADLVRAQNRTESLPWVDRAVVRRLWPNRIVVQLVETKPYALWQRNGQFSLV
ncbi:MAG: FtsQ-type POTRA domain-containing protein, partial [Litorimonas sp.]